MKNLDKETVKNYFLNYKTRVLSDEEKEELFIKYKIKNPSHQMPLIPKNDPLVLALEAKPGDVIAIERDDYGIKYTYYRYVKG